MRDDVWPITDDLTWKAVVAEEEGRGRQKRYSTQLFDQGVIVRKMIIQGSEVPFTLRSSYAILKTELILTDMQFVEGGKLKDNVSNPASD